MKRKILDILKGDLRKWVVWFTRSQGVGITPLVGDEFIVLNLSERRDKIAKIKITHIKTIDSYYIAYLDIENNQIDSDSGMTSDEIVIAIQHHTRMYLPKK